MIRRLLFSSVVLAAASATAFAADLPSRRAPPIYVPPPVPVFTWSGGYFGINAGYAFDSNHSYALNGTGAGANGLIASGAVQGYSRNRDDGFTGGGQVGYNYELGGAGLPSLGGLGGGGIVFGVEADAAYTDLSRANSFGGTGALTTTTSGRTEFVGTARGRLGLAFNNVLLYGTGGFAYGGVRDNVSINNGAGASVFSGGRDNLRTGYAYGGGIEYAIPTASFLNFFHSSAVTLKAEFIHYDLGTTSINVVNGAGNGYVARVRTDGNLARAGLNYKMNFFNPAPVVARY